MIPTVQRERPAAGRAAQSTPVLFVPSDVADLRASTLLAVHVLAQGPTTLTASVPSSDAATRALLLARAYGVADRLELRAGKDGHAVDRDPITVDASTVTPAELLDLVPEHLWDDAERPPETHAPLAGRRVAVITNVPIHHKVALLNAMATLLEGAGGTLHVLFTSGVPADRAWMVHNEMRFAYTALPSLDLGRPRGHHMLPR
ncbi:MAG TPA: hypothetical protein VJ689_12845, partial [Gaiellaceae bacterium]|nr:hypothetical protein [Gaiellaceae bacterium]